MKTQRKLTRIACIGIVLCTVLGLSKIFAGPQESNKVSFFVSPNGKYLCYGVPDYNKDLDDITHLMACNVDGSGEREVATIPGHYDLNRGDQILWLNNDTIACSSRESSRYTALSLDGKKLSEIVIPEEYKVFVGKVLSPDAQKVVFIGFDNRDNKNTFGLYIYDIKSGLVKCLVSEKDIKNIPAWSPDSSKVAFGLGGYVRNYPLMIYNVDTGKAIETGVKGVGTAWSPDGSSIACTTEVKGSGSWWSGIPANGRVGIWNVDGKKWTMVSPAGKYTVDKKTKKHSMVGYLRPLWSPDGENLAYIKAVKNFEIWVVNKDGQEARKIIDGKALDETYPDFLMTWSPDGRSLLIHKKTQIRRIDIASLKNVEIASWKIPEVPTTEFTIKKPGVIVETIGIPKVYGEAFANILAEAKKAYKDMYGFDLPETLTFNIERSTKGRCMLFTDGDSRLNLCVNSTQQLLPRPQSGIANIYGTCHELGHIVMYSGMRNLVGLPEGIGEGWAHYTGSKVLDRVAEKLGKNIWPVQYDNVAACEGTARLKKQIEGKNIDKLDPITAAAKVFYGIDTKYGPEVVGQAMRDALSSKPSGKELMPAFIAAVQKITGDQNACSDIPEKLIVSKLQWKTKSRNPDETFFADMKTDADETGALLRYDSGKSTGKISSAGSGYTVLFQKPKDKDNWLLDRIDLYGGRYGTKEAPKVNFTVYICDKDFKPIHEFSRPYNLFPDYKEGWRSIPIDPVKVPDRFYVCVDFNPTATRGVYMHYDENVKTSHSTYALPYTYISDVRKKYDWMIRPHLKKDDAAIK